MKRFFKQENMKIWILFIITLIIAIVSYNYLPEMIPMHFNAAGEVDNYENKIFIFLTPVIILVMIILAEVVRNVDPKKKCL